jgi:hypothetical protein
MDSGHYFENAPLMTSPGPARRKARNTTRVMFYKRLTYAQLRLIMAQRLGLPDMPPLKSGPNADSALSEYMLEQGLAESDTIGETLRGSHHRNRRAHLLALREAGRTEAYIKNRSYLLGYWHTLIRALDHEGAKLDKTPTPLQQRLEALMRDRLYGRVASAVGMNKVTLKKWAINGIEPRAGFHKHLTSLEQFFRLQQGELVDLLPYNALVHRNGNRRAQVAEVSPYRKLITELRKDPYKLRPGEALPQLREQWGGLFGYKAPNRKWAATMTALELHRAAQAVPDDQAEKQWDLRPLDLSTVIKSDRAWVNISGDYHCPSALAFYGLNVAPFIGWAQRSVAKGGAGLPPEQAQHLNLFCKIHLMNGFLDWKVERMNCTSKAILNFCMFVAMLTHPTTGYLPRTPTLAPSGVSKEEWIAMCAAAQEWSYKYRAKLHSHNLFKFSRDPAEAIKSILNSPSPLGTVMLGIRRLDTSQPLSGGIHEAVNARDCALLAILASGALRAENMRNLTYRADNTGQLRQDPDGGWRIVIETPLLKNRKGAAKKRGYNRAMRPDTWNYISRYIKDYRHIIGGNRLELVFVSAYNPNRIWEGLSRRVSDLTLMYFPNCPGFGPHGFRHILATHILMEGKGTETAVQDAAMALCDYPESVREAYFHILEKFRDRRVAEATAA